MAHKSNRPHSAIGPLASLDAATSTGAGAAYVFDRPYRNFGVSTLVVGATAATVLVEGTVATSSDAAFGQIASITASTSGETNTYNSSDSLIACQVRLTLDAMSSSDASVYGWIAAHD